MKLTALCLHEPMCRRTMEKTCLLAAQTLRIMKLTAIILLVVCLQVSATGYSQKVTLNMKNVPLQKVFKEINRQTGFQFFYKDVLLAHVGKIDITVKEAAIDEVLQKCFNNMSLTYDIADKTIVVKEKVPTKNIFEEPPPLKITGTVKDENGLPVAGVSVLIKGTKTGTTTNDNGYFTLDDVPEDGILVVTATNIETREVKISGRTSLDISVKIKISALDQVQIIGYGLTTKRLNTGAVSTIKGDDIKDRPVSNIMQALQGKLSGVAITNFSPGVGAPVQMLIRGQNSISSGNNPLIIIDGVIVNQNPGGLMSNLQGMAVGNNYQQGVSPLNYINPADVESVDVLKDADATSIYGSRGTNGVILITTRKNAIGKTKATVNVSTGWKDPVGLTERLNTEQYLKVRKDAFATGNMSATAVINPIVPTNQNAPDLTLWSQTAYTDYVKFELDNPAPNYNADVSISGGTKELNFTASGSYYKMYDAYIFKPYQERMIGRLQLNHTSKNNKLILNIGSIFGKENQKFAETNSGSSVLSGSNANAPNYELYNADGTLYFGTGKGFIDGTYYNIMPNKEMKTNSVTNNLLLNGNISYAIIKDLVAEVKISYNAQANNAHKLYTSKAVNIQNLLEPNPWGLHSTNRFTSTNIEPQLSYKRNISRAKIAALAGATFLEKTIDAISVKVNNPGSDDLLYSFGSGKPTEAFSNITPEKYLSVFGRINADWDRKYIANLTFRRDGSSKFGPDNRYANFASAGLAWIFTNESFLKDNVHFLSYGKLRGSYGTTGNNNIADFQYLSLLQSPTSSFSGRYLGIPGLNPATYANPAVQWETTTKNDIGLDLGFLQNRILLSTSWYRTVSTDLLVSLPLSTQTGFSSYVGNFPGKVQNSGLEIELTTQNLSSQSKTSWATKFNISNNKNVLKEFPGLEKTTYATKYQVGRALPSLNSLVSFLEFPYHFTSINPDNGLPQFEDVNKDGVISSIDRNNEGWWGSSTPTLWGGMTNSISYKGFSLDVFLQFSNGIFTKWNYNTGGTPIGSLSNPSIDVINNYWMQPGDVKKYPRLATGIAGVAAYTTPLSNYATSTAVMYKGYYIRLKNVQLTYSLPANILSKLKINNVSLYVSGENLAVYTPEKLYKDPEVFWGRSAGLLRTVTTGIRVEL